MDLTSRDLHGVTDGNKGAASVGQSAGMQVELETDAKIHEKASDAKNSVLMIMQIMCDVSSCSYLMTALGNVALSRRGDAQLEDCVLGNEKCGFCAGETHSCPQWQHHSSTCIDVYQSKGRIVGRL